MYTLDCFLCFLRGFQMIGYLYSFDDKYVVLQLYFPSDFRGQFLLTCINLTRFQRATKGAG